MSSGSTGMSGRRDVNGDQAPRDAVFIDVEVDAAVAADPALVAQLTEVCPVDIYAQNPEGTLRIVRENLDECVLCELCLNAAPTGTVRVLKLYSGESLPTA
jgi:NAD-dependent dihydropyrimidine dehydrogenase PreA subunit